ncbi:MAG TPA: hypothetical protein VGG19_05035 [Tepidisphaeraceae bacterium]|jgi:hypothetical protein
MQRRWLFGLALLLAALIIFAFSPVAHFHFLDWDDWLLLSENRDFLPVAWGRIGQYWGHADFELYAPLSYTLWAVIAWAEQWWSGNVALTPAAFHLANLGLHLLTSVFVLLLLHRLTKQAFAAFTGAMIFALHPLQVEPIAWVASFNTVLCGMFSAMALWAYVRQAQAEGTRKTRWFVFSCVALLAALFSKAIATPLPAIALLIEWLILERPSRQWIKTILIWCALVIPFLVIGRLSQSPYHATQIAFYLRPLVVTDSFAFYLCKLVLPLHLSIDYQRTPIYLLQTGQIKWTWMIAVAIALLALSFYRSRIGKWLLAGLAILFVATLPTSGIVGFTFQRYSTVADRYMYLGMIGIALGIAGIIRSVSPKILFGGVMVIAALFVTLDRIRLADWRDTLTLTAQAVNPDNHCALLHRIRAFALERSDQTDEAIEQYQLAIRYDDRDSNSYYDLANMLLQRGEAEQSAELYHRAIALEPERSQFHHNLAVALMREGKVAPAGQEFREAMELDPLSAQARIDYEKWVRLTQK